MSGDVVVLQCRVGSHGACMGSARAQREARGAIFKDVLESVARNGRCPLCLLSTDAVQLFWRFLPSAQDSDATRPLPPPADSLLPSNLSCSG